MTWAVNVTIVALLSLVLDGRRVDRDSTGLLFGRLVDIVVVFEGRGVLLRKILGDGGSQRRLAVINVT